MISWPLAVADNSGSAARRPVMIILAMERDAELLKVRAVLVAVRANPRAGRRGVKDGIFVVWVEVVDGCCGFGCAIRWMYVGGQELRADELAFARRVM